MEVRPTKWDTQYFVSSESGDGEYQLMTGGLQAGLDAGQWAGSRVPVRDQRVAAVQQRGVGADQDLRERQG